MPNAGRISQLLQSLRKLLIIFWGGTTDPAKGSAPLGDTTASPVFKAEISLKSGKKKKGIKSCTSSTAHICLNPKVWFKVEREKCNFFWKICSATEKNQTKTVKFNEGKIKTLVKIQVEAVHGIIIGSHMFPRGIERDNGI